MGREVTDDHRPLAAEAIRTMLVLAAVLAVVIVAVRRVDALGGLAAGVAVGIVDVILLSRSLDRFARSPQTSAKTLGTSLFSRFVSIGVLLGLVLCIHGLNPAAAIVGFLLMPVAVGTVGARDARRRRLAAQVPA